MCFLMMRIYWKDLLAGIVGSASRLDSSGVIDYFGQLYCALSLTFLGKFCFLNRVLLT